MEVLLDVLSGFIIAMGIVHFILPFWGYDPKLKDDFFITLTFTMSSLLRKYFWRRIMEKLQNG